MLSERLAQLLDEVKTENERIEAARLQIIEARQKKEKDARENLQVRLSEIRDEATAALDKLDEDRKLIARLSRAVDPPAAKTVVRRRVVGTASSTHKPVGESTKQSFLVALADIGEPSTVVAVARRSGVGQTTMSRAATDLREDGLIRPAGKLSRKHDSRKGGRLPQLWAITPDGMDFIGRETTGELTLVA